MRIDYKNAYVQISSFAKEGGVCEYHIMVHAAGDLTFEEQEKLPYSVMMSANSYFDDISMFDDVETFNYYRENQSEMPKEELIEKYFWKENTVID